MPAHSSRSRRSSIAARLAVLVITASVGLVSASAPAQAQACIGGTDSDFDGDGVADLAIGDPDATVNGKSRAGRVHIAYGDGGTVTIDADDIPDNDNGAGERFGFAMDSTDWNGDGCSDLFIGAPFENWSNNTEAEAGVVVFIPGSPTGLDTALAKNWSQASLGVNIIEPGDRFGYDLAAGTDTAGEPFLVAGSPGENTITSDGTMLDHIGRVVYVRPDAAVDFNQRAPGVSDDIENGDMYGYSVAASASGFVVGVPGESANYATPLEDVGVVNLFGHGDATTVPPSIYEWGQETAGVSGVYEAGDRYGADLDMVDFISTGGGASRMMIAVGAPGEAIGSDTSSGLASVMWSPGTGIAEYRNISQDVDKDPSDSTEPGDLFGASVAMVNRTPGQNTSTDTLLMAVGSPGEDADGLHDVGEVVLHSMIEDLSIGGDPVRSILQGAGLELEDGLAIGQILHTTETHLFVAVPRASSPAVYGVPWDNIVAGGSDPVLVYTPADFGLTAADVASFGASLA